MAVNMVATMARIAMDTRTVASDAPLFDFLPNIRLILLPLIFPLGALNAFICCTQVLCRVYCSVNPPFCQIVTVTTAVSAPGLGDLNQPPPAAILSPTARTAISWVPGVR